jgi:hypothetical protein
MKPILRTEKVYFRSEISLISWIFGELDKGFSTSDLSLQLTRPEQFMLSTILESPHVNAI